ncbi:flavocytochrome c [Campylobacter mucosalis]|uniref:flavocytochrome c n=1 Tax=Campylobacter mucosalis TaxID=202 RepID=UPI00146FE0A2|nr:flavocytochrome c [Campylobacter mucosalis]
MSSSNVSRRNFVKMSMVGAGALALGGLNAHADTKGSVKFDEEYDVVIIGSGFAGLAAAITSTEKGNKVLILEKMGRMGGNSVINGGIFAVPHSDLQQKAGIKDSNELFIKDCLKAGRGYNYVELINTIANRAQDAYKLTLKCGAKYVPEITHAGGHSVARSLQTANGSGSGIVQPMIEYFQNNLKGEIRTRAKFDSFVLDESGGVIGVNIREEYRFDTKSLNDDIENTTGTPKTIRAKKAVVLATGGFCRDAFFRKTQHPTIKDDVDSTNHPGATAGGLVEALRIGATPVQLSWIQYGPWACADEKGFGVGSMFNVNASFRYGISVNPKTGKRYMNELADRRTRSEAMFKVIGDDQNYPINFCDSQGVATLMDSHFKKPLESGVLKKFDTIEDMAAHFKIPLEPLKESIKKYNEGVKAGKDEFGKPMDTVAGIMIEKPPFYAVRGTPKLHHTMGGVMINTKAQVIDAKTHKPIPGLYAAGEVTGGVHGASRLGSVAISDCLVFGMIAGENI